MDKKPNEPLLAGSTQISSGWRHLDDNFETKSKSGVSSQKSFRSNRSGTSSQGGGYSSSRIRQRGNFLKAETEHHEAVCSIVKYAKYAQLVLCIIGTIFVTWWSLLIFPALFLVLNLYTVEDLKKKEWRKFIKFYVYVCLCIVQIVYLFIYLIESFVGVLAVNLIQIVVIYLVKQKINAYKALIEQYYPKTNNLTSSSAKEFFNPDVIKGLSKTTSNCDRKTRDAIFKKYEAKFKGKELPYEIGKAIIKEVNENNDSNRLMDLNGQTIKNSRYAVEEQISKMEKYQKSRQFSGGISDDSDSRDGVYIFFHDDLKKELYAYVTGQLRRECTLIDSKGIIAVRIRS